MKKIQTILDEFEEEFCNNHQKPIRFLRSVFFDEQDGAEQIEDFLLSALTHQFDELKEKIEGMKIQKKRGAIEMIFGDGRKEKMRTHTNVDVGYNQALSDILALIDSMK